MTALEGVESMLRSGKYTVAEMALALQKRQSSVLSVISLLRYFGESVQSEKVVQHRRSGQAGRCPHRYWIEAKP